MARVKVPRDGPPDTRPVTMPATASSPLARWCAVTPTVHLSAAVTLFQSASPSFSSVATASRAFSSNCLASASVFAPMDVLPFSSGMQPARPDSASTDTSNEAGRNRHWPVSPCAWRLSGTGAAATYPTRVAHRAAAMLQLVRTCRSEAMRREISSSAVTYRQPRLRSALVVLVVAAPPDARLVAPLGGAVEPLEHAPEAVHSARVGGIGVVDHAVLERERAHARPLARVRGHVGSGHGREGDRPLGGGFRPRVQRVAAALVVVFDEPLALLLLGEPDVEVEVEVAAERGRPGKRPPHPPLVRLQLRERRPRHRRKRDVVVGQVDDEAVEPVRDRRAGRTPRRVVGPEHEVVDEELRAPSEEVCQQGAPLVGLESILLVDPNPRQLLPPPRQLVAAPRDLLLRLEQLEPRCEPLFTCPGHVLRHRSSLLPSGVLGVPGLPSNCLAGASVFAPMDVLPRKRSRG